LKETEPYYKVYYYKKDAKPNNIPNLDRKITTLYLRLDGPDLYVFKSDLLSKVSFIISLPVCTFSLLELDSLDNDNALDSDLFMQQ
jgi:hypothetical protein